MKRILPDKPLLKRLPFIVLMSGCLMQCFSACNSQNDGPSGQQTSTSHPPMEALTIREILPNQIVNDGTRQITIQGTGFQATMGLFFGNKGMEFELVDSETIRLTVPEGIYGLTDIAAYSSAGQAVELKEALLIFPPRLTLQTAALFHNTPSPEPLRPIRLALNSRRNALLAAAENDGGEIFLLEKSDSGWESLLSFGPFCEPPPCLADGSCTGSETETCFSRDLISLVYEGESGGYFGILETTNNDTSQSLIEGFRLDPETKVKESLPLPIYTVTPPRFYSDLNGERVFAHHTDQFWLWNGAEWKSLFNLDGLGHEVTSFTYDAGGEIFFIGGPSGSVFGSHALELWDLWGGGPVGTDTPAPRELLFDPILKTLLAVGTGGQIYSSFRGGPWLPLPGLEFPLQPELRVTSVSSLVHHPQEDRFYFIAVLENILANSPPMSVLATFSLEPLP